MQRLKEASVASKKQKVEDLPEVLTGICVQEKSLRSWIHMALAYYSRGSFENFVYLLEAAIAGCLRTYASYKEDLARANVLLAAYFTRQAYKELGSRKNALQAKVTNILRLLDGMKRPEDRQLLVVTGYALMLNPGRAQEADANFVAVLRHVPSHIPALIGRGCLAYNRQDYIGALGFFKSVLMHQPRGPADVRVAIAHCFLKLGNLDSARRSFELALEHNGRCQNALLGIAILKLNQREKASIREGINLLCAAHELNNRHPVVLSILSSHFYYVRDYNSTPTLAGNSYVLTDIPQLQSQNCFQIARCFHATKQYDQATDFYTLAVRLAPESYVLPQLGLAQMNLRRGEQGKAKVGLEILLKVMPNQIDAMRLLAKIYLAEKRIDETIKLLLKVVESRCLSRLRDYDSWLSLALAYEQKQRWNHAIEAYQRAMRIYGGKGDAYPIEWLNNVAVIQKLAQMPQKALETIDEALGLIGTKGGDHKETNMLTLRFNRGRILEELHRCDLATVAYKDIVAEYPNYLDCYLRLGVMALRQNDVIPAIDYFKDVLKHDNDSLAARSSLGNIYVTLGLTTQAMYCLNVILNNSAKLDAFTLVAVGNVCLKKIQRSLATGDNEAAKRHQQKALLFFAKALDRDPRNLWAANGIGAALSCRRHQAAGEAVFKQIVEASKVCPPSAILNLAHMALELGKHQDAIEAYRQCLEHSSRPNNSVEVMLGLAKALFLSGNAAASKMWLSKARHLAPQDPVVMFNLGLAIQEDAEQLLGRPRGKSLDLMKAELELQGAFGFFDYLANCEGQTEVPKSDAAEKANTCQSLLTKLPIELQRLRELEVLDEERIRLQEELQKEEHEQRQQQRLQREQEMAKRQAVLDRTKKLLKEPNDQAHKKEKGHRGKKNEDDQDEDEEREGKKRKRSASKAEKSAKKKKTKDEAEKQPDKYKSKEFIDSDDNESEGSEDDSATKYKRPSRKDSAKKRKNQKAIYSSSDNTDEEVIEEDENSSPEMEQMDVDSESKSVSDSESETEPLQNNINNNYQDNSNENDGMSPETTIRYMEELQRRMQASTK